MKLIQRIWCPHKRLLKNYISKLITCTFYCWFNFFYCLIYLDIERLCQDKICTKDDAVDKRRCGDFHFVTQELIDKSHTPDQQEIPLFCSSIGILWSLNNRKLFSGWNYLATNIFVYELKFMFQKWNKTKLYKFSL